jgi:hypothetical protein
LKISLPTGSLCVAETERLLTLEFSGVIGADAVIAGSDHLSRSSLSSPEGRALVCRFDGVTWTERPGCYPPASMSESLPQYLAWPGACVVHPSALAWWRQHALNLAGRGVVRGIFTDAAEAFCWAAARAQVARAQAEQRQTAAPARIAHTPSGAVHRSLSRRALAQGPGLAGLAACLVATANRLPPSQASAS